MKYQEKLIKFIQLKNEIIEKESDIKYIVQEDINNIKKWDNILCEKVYVDLISEIKSFGRRGLNDDTCIWCLKKYIETGWRDDECDNCEYKINHGECGDNGSSYIKYSTKNVELLLTNEVYKNMLKEIEDI